MNKFYVACVKGDAKLKTKTKTKTEGEGKEEEGEQRTADADVFTIDEPLGYDSTCHTAFTASEWKSNTDPNTDADACAPPAKKAKLKESTTLFTVLKTRCCSDTNTDTNTDSFTYVLCMPITGRTHQIRVHLQHAGHPILNDHKYGGGDLPEDFDHVLRVRDEQAMHQLKDLRLRDFEGEGTEFNDFRCIHCPQIVPVRYKPRFDAIYLHCWKYVIREDWSYECPLPEWLTSQVDQQEMQRAAERLRKAKEAMVTASQ